MSSVENIFLNKVMSRPAVRPAKDRWIRCRQWSTNANQLPCLIFGIYENGTEGLPRVVWESTHKPLLLVVLVCLAARFFSRCLIRMFDEKNKTCSVFVTKALTSRRLSRHQLSKLNLISGRWLIQKHVQDIL